MSVQCDDCAARVKEYRLKTEAAAMKSFGLSITSQPREARMAIFEEKLLEAQLREADNCPSPCRGISLVRDD